MSRILVVDDEELARFTIREAFAGADYEICEATDGNQAIAKQREQPFDLIIMDIIMPEKEGVETIFELKKEFPNLQIIAMSGGGQISSTSHLGWAKRAGAEQTLSKPFSKNELLECVEGLL